MELYAQIDAKNHFNPIGATDFKKSLKIKVGDYIKVETWKERNLNFHRKFFAFLNTVVYFMPEGEKYDRFRNIDCLRAELMIMIGEVDIHISFEGDQNLIPKSISFKSMDNERFEQVYSACIDAALKYFLHDISKENFEKHLLNFL
jgi:Protein of unknown function (DUF1367)